jgi:hypothetical protein
MSFEKWNLIRFGIGSALLLSACGGGDGGKQGTGGAAGMGGAGGVGAAGGGGVAGGSAGMASDCAHLDYASYKGGDAVSFKDDVLPIVGFACTASSCHNPDTHKAGLNLGWHCNYKPSVKWTCEFPAVPDPDNQTTKPDDAATIAAVYASLTMPATTVNGGTVMRVAPGDPENSFLVVKLANLQNMKGYMCTNQDPAASSEPCGTSMPISADPYCQGSTRPRFDALARWIAQGAPNN